MDWESDLADDMTVALEEARKGEGPEQQLKFLEEWTVEAGSLVLEMWGESIQIANDLYDAGYVPGTGKSRVQGIRLLKIGSTLHRVAAEFPRDV